MKLPLWAIIFTLCMTTNGIWWPQNSEDMFFSVDEISLQQLRKFLLIILLTFSKNLTKIQMLNKGAFVNDRLFLKQQNEFISYRIVCSSESFCLLFWILILHMNLSLIPTMLLLVPCSWTSWMPSFSIIMLHLTRWTP